MKKKYIFYIHACIHTCIHIYIHANIHAHIHRHMSIHTYIHTYINAHIIVFEKVIEVCPSNIGKPFSMIKKKEVVVENECLFWPHNGRFFRRLQADSTPTALRCRRLHPDFEAITPQLRQNSWESCEVPVKNATCSFLTPVSTITADSEKYEAKRWFNGNLTFFSESSRNRVTDSCMCNRGLRCFTHTLVSVVPSSSVSWIGCCDMSPT